MKAIVNTILTAAAVGSGIYTTITDYPVIIGPLAFIISILLLVYVNTDYFEEMADK